MPFKYIFFSLLTLIALSIGFGFYQLFAFPDSAWPLKKGERVNLSPGEVLTQQFVANRDGLRRVEILFGKFSLERDDVFSIELRDANCSSVLAEKTFSGESFDSEYTYHFLFDRIENSKDQTFCFTSTFTTNRPVAKTKAPRFFIDEEAEQRTPHMIKNAGGETIPGIGPVAIRPGYTNSSFFANADEFFDRVSQYKPAFLKSWFLITFATLGVVLTFLTIALLIREEKE